MGIRVSRSVTTNVCALTPSETASNDTIRSLFILERSIECKDKNNNVTAVVS